MIAVNRFRSPGRHIISIAAITDRWPSARNSPQASLQPNLAIDETPSNRQDLRSLRHFSLWDFGTWPQTELLISRSLSVLSISRSLSQLLISRSLSHLPISRPLSQLPISRSLCELAISLSLSAMARSRDKYVCLTIKTAELVGLKPCIGQEGWPFSNK